MFDPKEYLAEWDRKLHYNYFVSVALAQGQYDLIMEFFRQVPQRETKGGNSVWSINKQIMQIIFS